MSLCPLERGLPTDRLCCRTSGSTRVLRDGLSHELVFEASTSYSEGCSVLFAFNHSVLLFPLCPRRGMFAESSPVRLLYRKSTLLSRGMSLATRGLFPFSDVSANFGSDFERLPSPVIMRTAGVMIGWQRALYSETTMQSRVAYSLSMALAHTVFFARCDPVSAFQACLVSILEIAIGSVRMFCCLRVSLSQLHRPFCSSSLSQLPTLFSQLQNVLFFRVSCGSEPKDRISPVERAGHVPWTRSAE